MKKYISLILTFVMLLTMIPLSVISVNAETVTGACGENLTWLFDSDTGTLTISGTGDMNSSDWSSYRTQIKRVVIEDGVTSIGVDAFYRCTSLTEVVISNSVTVIGAYAFRFCTSLAEIKIPDSVITIDDYAFYNCSSLKELVIPDSVTKITALAFYSCLSFADITVSENNENYSSKDGVLFNKDMTDLICYPAGKPDTSYIIPGSVTKIGNRAFQNCKSITEVIIPDSVNTIGDHAFDSCSSLKEVVIPYGITLIDEMTFEYCSSLTRIVIPNTVTTIGYDAFYNCTSLKEVVIPDSVTTIDNYAFGNCTSLEEIVIPNSITAIGVSVFYSCTSLKEVVIPNSVTEIGTYAFSYCTSLKEVVIPNSVTTIDKYAFSYCTSLEKIVIPKSVTSIGSYSTFNNCDKNLLKIYGYEGTYAQTYALSNRITFIAKKISDKTIVNHWKNQIRFDINAYGTFAGTFDYRVLASITSDDFMRVFSNEEKALEMIEEAGFVLANGTDVSNFDYETAKKVAMGESKEYTKVPVNYISTYFDTDPSSSGAGDYVMSCLVENIPEADKNMSLATVAYIAYNDGNGNLIYMFYPATASACLAESYDKFFPLAFPS